LSETLQILTFLRGGSTFGLEVGCIRKVLRPGPIQPLSGTAPFVAGRVRVEGRSEMIVDPAVLFGNVDPVHPVSRVILVHSNAGRYGFAADTIDEVAKVDRAAFGPPPPFLSSDLRGLMRGVLNRATDEVLLLDAERLPQAALLAEPQDGVAR
jgi:chemotaxis signal transduction protein